MIRRDTQVYTGVMDADTDPRYVREGNYLYALNVHNGINNGLFGSSEDALGNIEITNTGLPSGTNKCVGSFEDIAGSSIIFCNYNSGGYHGIYRYFKDKVGYADGVIETVYKVKNPSVYTEFNPNPLNFQIDSTVACDLVGDDFYFTEYANDPKCINIVKANENKPRKFKLFVADIDVATAFDFNIYQEGNASSIFNLSWNSTGDKRQRIEDFLAQVNTNICPFAVVDKTTYVEITLFAVGIYWIELKQNGVDYKTISPVNFYLDNINTIPVTLSHFHKDLIAQSKPAPYCNPVPTFKTDTELVANVHIPDFPIPYTTVLGTPVASYYYIGFDNDSTGGYYDLNGSITLGAWASASAGTPTVKYRQIGTDNIVSGTLTMDVQTFGLGTTFRVLAILSSGESVLLYNSLVGTATLSIPVNVNIGTSVDLRLMVVTDFGVNVTNASVNFGIGNKAYSDITSTAFQFRVKYIYSGNKQSVYGAISRLIYSKNPDFDAYIELDFSDDRLQDPVLFQDVEKVVLAVSKDAGTTWFDFKTLDQEDFAGTGQNTHSYNNTNVLIPVAPADVILPYFSVPLNAKSEALVDKRIWHGGIIEGYDKVNTNVEYDVHTDLIQNGYTGGRLSLTEDTNDPWINYKNVASTNPFVYGVYYYQGMTLSVQEADFSTTSTVRGTTGLIPNNKVQFNYSGTVRINANWSFTSLITYVGPFLIDASGDVSNLGIDIVLYNAAGVLKQVILSSVAAYGEVSPGVAQATSTDSQSLSFGVEVGDFVFIDIRSALMTGPGGVDPYLSVTTPVFGSDFVNLTFNNTTTSDTVLVDGWKRGWKGRIGTVYYDESDRRSAVCNGTEVTIPYYEVNDFGNGYIDWSLFNDPPSWATKYQFVRTKDLNAGRYFIYSANNVTIVDQTGATNANGDFVKISLSNITQYQTIGNPGADIAFSPADGDRIRLISYPDSTSNFNAFPEFYDLPITQVVNDDIWVKKIDETNFYNNIRPGMLMEIYTPLNESDELLYYEFGECYPIEVGNFGSISQPYYKKYHVGQTQNQSYPLAPITTVTPATGRFSYGDVFFRERLMIYSSGAPFNAEYTAFISSQSPFENDISIVGWEGRPNSENLPGRIERDSSLRFSDQIIQSTLINGLNAFQPLNEKQYDTNFGLIEKMQVVNNDVLKLLFENGYQLSVYVGQDRIQQTQGNPSLLVDSTSVAGDSHLLQRTWGTLNPESVTVNDEGDMLGFDQTEGVVFRASGNGLIDVSALLQKTTFKNYATQRNKLDKVKSKCPSVYDLYHDEYILTLNDLAVQPEILPTAVIDLNSTIDPTIRTTTRISVYIEPNNFTVATNVVSAASLRDTIQGLFVGIGWTTAIVNNKLVVTAPSVQGYEYSNVVIKIDYTDSGPQTSVYNFPFTGGQIAGVAPAFTGVTLAFNKQKNGWTTYYSFVPELYGRLRNDFVSFRNGVLFLHNRGLYKNYYTTQYAKKLKLVSNRDFPKNKVFKSLWVTGLGLNDAVLTIPAYQGIAGMASRLSTANFAVKQGIQCSPILRDETTPGARSADDARVNGRPMVGQLLIVEYSNSLPTKTTIQSTDIVYFWDENS